MGSRRSVAMTFGIIAKQPVIQGKLFLTALQKLQNRICLILGQHTNYLQRMKSRAGARDERIETVSALRIILCVAACNVHSHTVLMP